jgi:Ni/Co efflux regulator RcnB
MKKQIALIALAAAALIAAPATIHAQDAAATNSAAAPTSKKHGDGVHGAVVAVDATAMTVTVGTKTYNVTSDTKITKAGQPATLSDVTVGETVSIGYKKDDAGKLNATTIRVGAKKKKTE